MYIFTICSRVRIGCIDFSDHLGCVDMLGSSNPVHRCRSCYILSSKHRELFSPDETDPVTEPQTQNFYNTTGTDPGWANTNSIKMYYNETSLHHSSPA